MKKTKLPIYAALFDSADRMLGWIHMVGCVVKKGSVTKVHPSVEIHLFHEGSKERNRLTFGHPEELDIFIDTLKEASDALRAENKVFYKKEKEYYEKRQPKNGNTGKD